ncbi:MAG: Coenzyme F420 hydrogenase/dehydrogenase, beta subunit C-terminal domain [candidate division WOR-3 bacterium]|jgi:formate dehydrogenase subunit beta|nr:Coenzyme F420 hydrogenase/dehydrogenase, beta subunit C-terminal domain [candidate division WOR-3 bacterium]MCR4424512.1 Coenzyme F420 hydrogenase/dehydrogenase, beta subunit C-terminal domain [candidate division WOR-3 bacterium]MDH7519640.1 Coenzyme F420 hydrogenase/dehydrogenase, beta subunit C-terminal domain [bacterium]
MENEPKMRSVEEQKGRLPVASGGPVATIKEVCAQWLEQGILSGIMMPAYSIKGVAAPVLFTDPQIVRQSGVPFLPAMGVNTASVVDEMRFSPAPGVKVGVFLRPCEARAVVELVKLQQVVLDGLVLIGVDCPGTYRTADFSELLDGAVVDFVNRFLQDQARYLNDERFRTACAMCEYPTPLVCDLHIGFLGMNPGEALWVESRSEKGAELYKTMNVEPVPVPESRQLFLKDFRAQRQSRAEERIKELDAKALGPENLVKYFAACLNCHNCMKVCPVCYCRECFFESEALERELDEVVRITRHKGGMRLPQGTLLFHITRMNHMMTSCVQCGICEDSCPVKIGLSVLFKKVSRNAQKEFDYLSGRSLDEPLPLVTFREDEFRTIGE